MDDKLIVFIAQKWGHYVLPSSKLPNAISLFFPQFYKTFDHIRSDLITFFKILKLHKVFIFKRTLLATVYCRALFSQKSGLSYLLCTMNCIAKLRPKNCANFHSVKILYKGAHSCYHASPFSVSHDISMKINHTSTYESENVLDWWDFSCGV